MDAKESFDRLVSDLDYPMFIVTVAARGERAGCLVGFVTQASIDPPRLLVMLSKANRTYDLAQVADSLAVHFLHEGNDDLARLFGEETGDDTDKFAACEWHEESSGPALVGTRGWVGGTVLYRLDSGDHVAHLLAVDAAFIDVPGAPLAFQNVRDLEPGHPS
ncbi:MAG: flavin reductase [Acidimicrobiales bacterium]|nr:flavin reductase [Acidimicrobiales bacterium]